MATVLIVEDDADVRTLWVETLTLAGHVVNTANDGVQAIKQIGSQRYDVILFDLLLPRLSGLDAIKLIRRTEPDLPILVITGTHESGLTQQAREAGVQYVLTKPVDLNILRQMVNALAQSKSKQSV